MKEKFKKAALWILDLVFNVAIIFGIVLIVQTWIVAPFDVFGASMCNTLNFIGEKCEGGYGEKIIINEVSYLFNDPSRGDIIVFKAPVAEDKYFIKRVIGLPGETVEIRNGNVYVTEKDKEEAVKLEEPYLSEENEGKTIEHLSNFSVFKVPEGQYFLLGDNRQASTDSRSCFQSSISLSCKENPEQAFVAKDKIRGKAWAVWWPLKNIRTVDHPDYPGIEESYKTAESLEEK